LSSEKLQTGHAKGFEVIIVVVQVGAVKIYVHSSSHSSPSSSSSIIFFFQDEELG
jgi:hypothetical protein